MHWDEFRMSRIVIVMATPGSLLNLRGYLIKALVGAGHDVFALAGHGEDALISKIELLGAKFLSFPVKNNGMNPFLDGASYLALRKIFRKLSPDIVFTFTVKPNIWGGMAARVVPNARLLMMVEGLGYPFQKRGLRRVLGYLVSRMYKAAVTRASSVIFLNSDNRDEFVRRNIVLTSKTRVIPGIGVPLDYYCQQPLLDGVPSFLVIARLLGDKGLREYAKAASIVKEKHPATIFRLVGSTDSSPDGIPLEEIQDWNRRGWVDYLGVAEDVRPFLTACHIFVLPSYHEGMPRTVLEAMAIGRPILATDIPGCRETVLSGENGFLVPKANAHALAERMCWFVENRDKWNAIDANHES